LGVGVWFAVSCAPAAASARERSFSLAWTAPPACPDAAAVEGYVEEDVGAPAYGPTAVHARGTVSDAPEGRYSVELELALDAAGARSSRRTLVDNSCEAVSQAAALLVALAIRAQAAPDAAPPAPAEAPTKEATNWHERPFFGVAVVTDLGSLPRPTVGLGVAGGATWAIVRLEPTVAYFAPQSGSVAARADLGARFRLAVAGARVCTPFPRSRFWIAPCAGGGVDLIWASGFGARTTRIASTAQAIATAALLGGWDISPIISMRLEVGAALPLARPEFMVDGVGNVYRRAPLALRSAFGLELHF
ncbi:MAG TPA: hypothetical protein VNW92_13520, partial [Polyangiaceae bacterium]|nr:hypothetical protein [Polyangiaceae bacterium]